MKRKSPFMLWLVVALMALLPLLAIFQYHWLGEVSRGERERMKNNLQMSAAQFGQDFDREIKKIFAHFQMAMPPLDETSDAEMSERYRRWQASTPHTRLISGIYQTQLDDQGEPQLKRFVFESKRFEPCEWPAKLSKFRQALEQQRQTQASAEAIFREVLNQSGALHEKGLGSAIFQIPVNPINEELPGVIIPIMAIPDANEKKPFTLPLPRAYRIVTLDLDYLKQDFLPELANQYFSNNGQSDYYVAVIDRQRPQQIIYQSDPGWPGNQLANGDVTESFFKARINEDEKMFYTHGRTESSKDGKNRLENRRFSIGVFRKEIGAPLHDDATKSFELARSMIKMNNDGIWQLAVKHRAGSLEAAVAGARRRNLMISFGILLLLSLSVGLIVLSSRRAQKLATQQMEFVAGVSHELRTPLAVICSAAENLADGVIDNRDQMIRYGGLIRDEGRRLTGMVEQVLEFAGAQSGRRVYDLRPIELTQAIDGALAACHLQIVEGGFEIEKQIPADLPLVKADLAALSRAIQNLISNAVKYSGESRQLSLSVEVVKSKQADEIQLKVADQGLGIAPSELPHIFEPFYRGKEVAAAQIHGNGLGLSLVKHIVEAHGGRISVESRWKQGTTFTLSLPVVPAAELLTDSTDKNYEQAHFAR